MCCHEATKVGDAVIQPWVQLTRTTCEEFRPINLLESKESLIIFLLQKKEGMANECHVT